MGAATKTLKFAERERALSVRRDTLNEENRTVDVVFATENPVESYHNEIGDFEEVLDCTPEAGNLTRLNQGGQFIKEHQEELVVGVVENARFENRVGIATLRYAKNALGEEEWGLMKENVRRNFSVRYRATLLRQEAVGSEGGNVFRAVAWEAKEISVVSVNADPKCQALRSRADGETSHTTTIEMTTQEPEVKPAGNEPAKIVTIDENKLRSDIQAKLVKNISEINEASDCFRKAGHDVASIATKAINEGKSVDEFRADAVRALNVAGAAKAKNEPTIEVVGERRSRKTLGEIVTEHDAFRALGKGQRPSRFSATVTLPEMDRARADFLTTSITNYNGIVQLPEVITQGVQPLRLQNLLAEGTTSLNSVPYMQEDTFTATAAAVAEGAAKPEQAFDLSQTSAPIKKIAAWTTMSDELLDDAPAVASYINGRLIYSVQIKEEDALLNGAGGSNITGILQTGSIQTQALGADTKLDAFYKAITKVRAVGFFEPDGVVIHPNDWQELRLLKDGNLNYFGGGPFTGAYGTAIAPVGFLWGLPVVVTTMIAENTALVGAFKLGAMVWRRKGISVDMTNSNEDDFKNNLVTVRAEERLGLAVWRPKAFCTVTGI